MSPEVPARISITLNNSIIMNAKPVRLRVALRFPANRFANLRGYSSGPKCRRLKRPGYRKRSRFLETLYTSLCLTEFLLQLFVEHSEKMAEKDFVDVKALLSELTLGEKVDLLAGQGSFRMTGLDKHGVPALIVSL